MTHVERPRGRECEIIRGLKKLIILKEWEKTGEVVKKNYTDYWFSMNNSHSWLL